MKLKEAKEIVKLLSDEWDLGKRSSGGQKNVCAWIYFCEIMEQSEAVIIKYDNDKVIGFCGYEKFGSKKYIVRKIWYKFIKNILINSHLIKNKQGMLNYLKNYDYTPDVLKNYFDGQISILIVDKDYRNKGIGRKMILDIFDLAKGDDIKKMQILSDESCNYRFYEKLGCHKVHECIIENIEPGKVGECSSEIGYIYEKKLLEEGMKNE